MKALCASTIWDTKTCWIGLTNEVNILHAVHIKEIEDDCTCASTEAENCWSSAIWDAESWGASNAWSIQQSHIKDIQHLEAEAIEEEGRDFLTFLTACGAALRANLPEAHGIMVTPYNLLLGNAPMSALLSIPLGVSPPKQKPALQTPPFSTQQQPDLHLGPSSNTTFLTGWRLCPHLWLPPMWLPRSHPTQSRRKWLSIRPWQGVGRKPLAGIPS